jgi:trimethylamine--corrinoid protein Co-methyltransferase
MARIVFGDAMETSPALVSLINVNSPLTYDATMAGALEVYARAGQACIVSPFIVGGAMAPASVVGTLTQILAEVMAGVAYTQLIRPGAPMIFGAFVTSIDMNSGAPTFGTPEAAQVTYGAGQLARRLGLPYRSAGAFTGSKRPDAQAGYESANSLNAGLLAGVNFMLHACGWLEGGLVASPEKFVMDDDQLGALHRLARRPVADEEAQAMDAMAEVGPGGHYLGCAHTQRHYETAFWKSDVLDYRPFETWADDGGPDTEALAARRVDRLLAQYEQPPLDEAVAEALADYVARRKAEMPDAFG